MILRILRKTVTVVALACLVAKPAISQVKVGPTIGLNYSTIKNKSLGTSESGSKIGLNIGAVAQMQLISSLYLQTALIYSMMGGQYDYLGANLRYNLSYLMLPIALMYRINPTAALQLYLGLGPYFAYALAAKARHGDNDYTLHIGGDAAEDDLKPLDIGLNTRVGALLFSHLGLQLFYMYGLTNNMPGGNSDNSMRDAAAGLSLYYLLGK